MLYIHLDTPALFCKTYAETMLTLRYQVKQPRIFIYSCWSLRSVHVQAFYPRRATRAPASTWTGRGGAPQDERFEPEGLNMNHVTLILGLTSTVPQCADGLLVPIISAISDCPGYGSERICFQTMPE